MAIDQQRLISGPLGRVKGDPVFVLAGRQRTGLADVRVDVRGYNAVQVAVLLSGSGVSCDLRVQGAPSEGGVYQTLPDTNATQSGLTGNALFEVVVGSGWVTVNVTALSGTFTGNQGVTVIITPYIAAGQTSVNQSVTANQNLAQVAGTTISDTNPVPVRAVDETGAEAIGNQADAEAAAGNGSLIAIAKRLRTLLATLPAGENHIGQVAGPSDLIDVTLTLDTLAYAAGDVLADTQVVANAARVADGRAVLQSVTVIDEDDQGAAMDIYLLSANVSLGTENAAPSISDANARNILGVVSVAAADYKDLGGVRVATLRNLGLLLEAVSTTRDVYVAVVTQGTPTHTAAGVRLRLGLLW